MELYSSAFGNHPTPPKVSGLGVMVATQQEVKNLACRKSVRVAGSRPQGPVGQVSRGLGARAPRAWGPAHQGPGPFPHKTSQITIFSQTSWWEPGEGSRDTPPTPPPAFWGCKGERKRVFTLSAFGNHPTHPPRSADSGKP